ncbi:hypothetical protein EJB05_32698, partial [Eragrostis curvula]
MDTDVPCSGSSIDMNLPRSIMVNEHSDKVDGKFLSDLPDQLQGHRDFRISLDLSHESCVGGQVTHDTISGDSNKNGEMDVPCGSGSSNIDHDHLPTRDMAAAGKKKLLPMIPRRVPWRKFRMDDRDPHLISSNLSWEEKVVNILHMVRRREITEYNPKKYISLPTRFCRLNIAFFDLDKESDFKRDPRTSKIPYSYLDLDPSINVMSINVAKSDVPYPIQIYGTVIARDQVDYRCVYLFKRSRDNPQLITLTIKGEEEVDQDFSKGLIERNAVRDTDARPRTKGLDSRLSSVRMVYMHVPYALEASLEVNILNEESQFTGKITAGKDKTEMVLYDSKVVGTENKLGNGGSVSLTRRVVAVPWGATLLLKCSVPRAKRKYISLEHDEEEWTGKTTIIVKMKLTSSLAIISTLLTHHLSLMVTSISNHTTVSHTSSIGFSFKLFCNLDGPDHTIHHDSDGFLHFQRKLNSSATNVTTLHPETFHPVHLPKYEATVLVGSGSGIEQYVLKLDSMSSLTWLQCKPCSPSAKQLSPIFDPTESTTFRNIASTHEACKHPYDPAGNQCAFHLVGPRGMSVHGFLALESFLKDEVVHDPFLFGCSHSTEKFESEGRYAGVFGMGRMEGSLVMQATAQGLTQFSYCLFGGSNTKRQGLLSFGTDIPQNPNSRTTRILPALYTDESEYYVRLVGISLGEHKLDKIHPDMFARHMHGQGGCMVDLGTPLTVMVEEAYCIIEDAIWSYLQHHQAERVNRHGFGLCVRATEAITSHLQPLSLHFLEEEAVLVLSPKQLFLMMDEKHGQIMCLAMTSGQRTIIGAFQQVDTRFIYDLKNSKLSFAPESCIQDTVEVV